MDRLNQLRSEAGGSGDSSFDTSSAASDAYLTANENSKYFSVLDESSLNISKDNVNSDQEAADAHNPMISNLSPISKSSDLDNYKIGKQIEAANILSGGINIFDDNENSYDGDELVIDDNAPETDEKASSQDKMHEGIPYSKVEDNLAGNIDDVEPVIPSKDTEVVLQIDGNNVDAIDIGNGLYLYRKEGEEELAAVQIVNDDQQQSSFKFLKVRENTEGNLEVYEEIEIEVPKEIPVKEVKSAENLSHIPIKDINKVISEPTKVDENVYIPQKDTPSNETNVDMSKESHSDSKTELNLNAKMMKFSESRKSPVVGSFTPMTFHSTPNKEGIPLTKTMVNQQLHPSRHSDNVKKTIEVHTDSSKQKHSDVPVKNLKEICETNVPVISDKECQQTPEENNDVNIMNIIPVKKIVDNQDTTTINNEEKKDNVSKSASEVSKSDLISERKDELITQESKEVEVVKETLNNFANETCTQNKEEILIIDTNNPDILKNKIIVENYLEVKDNCSKGNVNSKDESNEKSSQECENILVEETTSNKKLHANQNSYTSFECNPEKQLENKSDTNTSNIASVEASKSETDPNTKQEMEKDSLKSAKDMSHLQNKELIKVASITPYESENLTSNLTTKNDESAEITLNLPKSNLIQLETNKEQALDNSKTNIDKSIKEVSNHTVIESTAVATHPVDSKNKSITFEALNKIPLNDKQETRMEISKINKNVGIKTVSNKNAAVPFGKWTEANRQEFLNKIKETKVTTNNSNTKQLKQPNDLNRRDVLQKIDSQRQQSNNAMTKVQEQQKLISKNETTAFVKSAVKHDTKLIVKDRPASKIRPISSKKNPKDDSSVNHQTKQTNTLPTSNTYKKEPLQRREINNQALIDRTIEGIINRVPPPKIINEDRKQNTSNMEGIEKQKGMTFFGPSYHAKNNQPVTLNEIETKMNELHGIPFVERPAHELPQKFVVDTTPSQNDSIISIPSNVPNVLPFAKKAVQHINEVVHIDSDEEIIEHEPITGDVNPKKTSEIIETAHELETDQDQKVRDESKRDVIITEKDFDKFYRRNSVTYENCLTVNVDGKEPPNFVQTVVEKDIAPKKLTRNEVLLAESKAKSTHKQQMLQARHSNYQSKIPISNKCQTSEEESYGKNYQSKVQIAYQTALTAKRQKESPITIIEEKPVKVVFMDSNVDFLPCQLNVQGEKLSPIKQFTPDLETFTHSTTDSLDSDILDNFDGKAQDEAKSKSRHQRKQVLTPVEVPDMELIQSDELGIEMTPKKKRRIEDRLDKSPKNHVPKKSYLLGRANADDKNKTPELDKVSYSEINNHNNSFVSHPNPITAIDNLVKAAELLENQAENSSRSPKTQESDSQKQTPPKRGRGRPRKYPLPDPVSDTNKVLSPQKKPRLIDAKVVKPKIPSREETDEDGSSDDEVIKENWTMGKINENIVCPICSKLFRSENVVFKHVKHCTGPSPNRSESDKRRLRESQESETRSPGNKSDDMDLEEQEIKTPKKRKSKESTSKVSSPDNEIIEGTITKEKTPKQHESRKSTLQTKNVINSNNNLVCEICGKSFRHLSYLAQHKLQHKNEDQKKHDSEVNVIKSVFSCETCKKEFRKLHHLVQHRIIHNPSSIPTRTLRKSSSEQSDNKVVKEQSALKQTEDHSAGFRCEPCDKSFRKLHHLVEHRETHDGINRQKANEVETPKPAPMHQCDICDKTFKKLQLLNEHKEQHLETCSEKSDDKSVKSSLSTKDIIHECSLCYMVFPNEHSLNKHAVICLRKKKQSIAKAKQAALKKELEGESLDAENSHSEECNLTEKEDSLIIVEDNEEDISEPNDIKQNKLNDERQLIDKRLEDSEAVNIIAEVSSREEKDTNAVMPIKHDLVKKSSEAKEKALEQTVTETTTNKEINIPSHIPTKINNDENLKPKVNDTLVHKKKHTTKEKVIPTVTKRQKSLNVSVPVIEHVKPAVESSDEDEVRYMLNPNFIEDTSMEERSFMQIKTKKRNSLHFERPSSRDLLKRRISMQLPPKISRLKSKSIEQASFTPSTSTQTKSTTSKANEKPTPATDSDDSETKYAFPETIKDPASTSEVKQPQKRKSIAAKRKLLSGVAKRKSLGKSTKVKHKLKPEPIKPIKKRTTEMELRCDCGKLFSSAALLSRHTLLDHTPPRSRRRRSPLPEVEANTTKVTRKTPPKKSNVKANVQAKNTENADKRKPGVATRKSTTNNNDVKPSKCTRKSLKSTPAPKTANVAAHKGVPVPDELKKHVAKQHLKNK